LFDMYAQPHTSYGDIVRWLKENDVQIFGNYELNRASLSRMMRNPSYVMADLDVYDFFKSQGTEIANDAADFNGINGCYLYRGRNAETGKHQSLKEQLLVLAPHEGIISSDLWLKCRRKLLGNVNFQGGRKAKNTWLAGKIKCGNCGYALMSLNHGKPGELYQSLRCSKRAESKSCIGSGPMRTVDLENFIFSEMKKKLGDFQTLSAKNTFKAVNPKMIELQVKLTRVEAEIGKLVDTLSGANNVLLSYANAKILQLDEEKNALIMAIADLSAETVSVEQLEKISGYLDNWQNVSFDDKRAVVDGLITRINATSESVEIQWKI
ncbi:recombinase family protein, partial [Ruminococcaceae bacterium OttesenSCG-928-N02]|nr:recombinase family protein [Ruminococcaceae bacterium OttesenSCG-928-N02]